MRTIALGIAITALGVLGSGGCAHERGDLAGTATTTSAVTASSLNTPTGCSTNLPHILEFDEKATELSPDERVEVQSWANCLQQPQMMDSTVVLLGPNTSNDETVFVRRAEAVRDELCRRGVERSRIVIGGANAAREGGRLGPAASVHVELTSSSSLRAMSERK